MKTEMNLGMPSEYKDKWPFSHHCSFSLYHGRDHGFVLAFTVHCYEMSMAILNTILLIMCTKITLGFLKEEVKQSKEISVARERKNELIKLKLQGEAS